VSEEFEPRMLLIPLGDYAVLSRRRFPLAYSAPM